MTSIGTTIVKQIERQRLADEQRAHEPVVARELEPVDVALVPRRAVLVLGLGEVLGRGQDDRDRREGGGVDQQRDRHAPERDQPARQRRAEDRGGGEAEVHQRVALADQVLRLQQHADRPARQAAPGDRQRAVQQAEREHERQEEAVPVGHERQRGERQRLDRRTAPAASCAARSDPGARSAPWPTTRAGTSQRERIPQWAQPTPYGHRPESRAPRPRSSRRDR